MHTMQNLRQLQKLKYIPFALRIFHNTILSHKIKVQ